ncbi:MAG: cbb3-type cytochrome c oxidase subunit 3 [Rhodobacteraceae bacterium]|nr:cbb3-type cytochrome c oxidase subunit 3 [Paracoccaceae bacterium]
MELYTFLREFADSWALLGLVILFVGIVLYTFRRSSKNLHKDCADIPFRHDDAPATHTETENPR